MKKRKVKRTDQMARLRMADVDIIATRNHAAEVALAHKAERNPERAREIREYSNAVQRGKMKQRRLGGEHVLALLGITLKVRMVA